MVNVVFLGKLATRLTGERCVCYPAREPGGLGAARMGAEGFYHVVLDPSICNGDPGAPDFLKSYLHELGHVVCGHVSRQYISDLDRERARAAYVKTPADVASIAAVIARHEAEANAWADATAPTVENWCRATFGRSFADLAHDW